MVPTKQSGSATRNGMKKEEEEYGNALWIS